MKYVGSSGIAMLSLFALAAAACASSQGETVVKDASPQGETVVKEGSAAQAALQCELTAPASVRAGEPVSVKLRLKNSSSEALYVLGWRSPFEGLFGNDWQITMGGGAEIPYVGPMAKRGDPEADDYVSIAAGQVAEAEVQVSLAYDMKTPGRYRIAFRGPLMDVTTNKAEVPRPLAQHKAMPIACPAVETEVKAP
jgi:hypothetical protein